MVSPEVLRRYPFFGGLASEHLNAIAMLADEETFQKGDLIFEADRPAETLYFLMEGGVDLHYLVIDEINSTLHKEFFISEINAGEPFGLSALIDPYHYTGAIRAAGFCRVLRFNAAGLRALCELDPKIDAALMRQMTKALMSRLHDTRIQLAAARA